MAVEFPPISSLHQLPASQTSTLQSTTSKSPFAFKHIFNTLSKMMFTPLLALAFAAIAPIVSAYPITGSVVNCRSGPGTSYSVVKSYKKGTNVGITCQTSGPSVNGNAIWDKTKDGCYIADYYIKTGSNGYVTKKCSGSGKGSGKGKGKTSGSKLPTLSATQTKHAKAIIKQAKKEKLGRQGCLAGIATALVEVSPPTTSKGAP